MFQRKQSDTYKIYKKIQKQSDRLELSLAGVIEAIYSNQIRNSFAHSEFWISEYFVIFENHDRSKKYSIPSLRIETWDRLFDTTKRFIHTLFENRLKFEKKLNSLRPYPVNLPEFEGSFRINKGKNKTWVISK